ncbi:hypothetical protein [Vibrio marisflavi]|uniref:hypothetical protein n=1 Tax=Vibrio marisflavi TaxID=1216040 RepID=UPI00338DE365
MKHHKSGGGLVSHSFDVARRAMRRAQHTVPYWTWDGSGHTANKNTVESWDGFSSPLS